MYSSYHPRNTTTRSIPYSLGLRIMRIFYFPEDSDKRFYELREKLLARNSNQCLVDWALDRARAVPRDKALSQTGKGKKNSAQFYLYWRSMTQDSYMREVFLNHPLLHLRNKQI